MKKLLKGTQAFTSTLLFGSSESQGLIKTLSSASLEAGKNFGSAIFVKSTQDTNFDSTGFAPEVSTERSINGYHKGPDGYGYYEDGVNAD